MQFCCFSNSAAVKIFSHIHNTFCLECFFFVFFLTLKELNMTPISKRLCLTIRHTKHLFRGQRKECCISTGLVEEKKAMMWLSEPYSQDWLRYRVFSLFSLGVSICEYKAAVTHKYYMVWRCKAGINDWGVCLCVCVCTCERKRESVYGRSLWGSA